MGEYNVPLLTKIFVTDAMNPHATTLGPDDTVGSANRMMLDKGFRGIPITQGEKVVGIVTMSDLLRIPREQMDTTPLKTVMTVNLLLASPDDSLLSVLDKMTSNGIGRLPVVTKDTGKLVGIITRTDIIRAYNRAVDLLFKSEQTGKIA